MTTILFNARCGAPWEKYARTPRPVSWYLRPDMPAEVFDAIAARNAVTPVWAGDKEPAPGRDPFAAPRQGRHDGEIENEAAFAFARYASPTWSTIDRLVKP